MSEGSSKAPVVEAVAVKLALMCVYQFDTVASWPSSESWLAWLGSTVKALEVALGTPANDAVSV